MRDRYRGEAWYGLAERFADEWDQTSFDPDYPTEPLAHFEPRVQGRLRQSAHPVVAPTQRHRWFTRPDNRARRRTAALVRLAVDQARADFEERYPEVGFGPVVAVIAAYNEEDNSATS